MTPRNPPESIQEIFAALPEMGFPFWLGVAFLLIGVLLLFIGASTFSHDVMGLNKTKRELAHLLNSEPAESNDKYARFEFKVDPIEIEDREYGFTFKAITLYRKKEVFQQEQYTYRDPETRKEKIGYRDIWEVEDYETLSDPEYVDLPDFRLHADYLEEKSIGVPHSLPDNHPKAQGYKQILKDGDLYFIPINRKSNAPQYGDYRISYWGAKRQIITAIAKIEGGILEPYSFSRKHYFIKEGKHSTEDFINEVQSDTRSSFVLPLLAGCGLVIFGAISCLDGYLGRPLEGLDLVVLINPVWKLAAGALVAGFAKGYFQ